MKPSIRKGDMVLVRLGVTDVPALVLSLFGSKDDQYARLEVHMPPDEDEDPRYESLTLPIRLLKRKDAA